MPNKNVLRHRDSAPAEFPAGQSTRSWQLPRQGAPNLLHAVREILERLAATSPRPASKWLADTGETDSILRPCNLHWTKGEWLPYLVNPVRAECRNTRRRVKSGNGGTVNCGHRAAVAL